mgnify:CR=1 FL=1
MFHPIKKENATVAKQIAIDHVFKVFGNDPKTALNLVKQGRSKQEILAQTGQSIGVFDADFTIEAGEIFGYPDLAVFEGSQPSRFQ